MAHFINCRLFLLHEESSVEDNCRSVVLEQAVQLGLDMFGILARYSTRLLDSCHHTEDQLLSDELHELVPSIKIWSDWMTCHSSLWNPPPLPLDPEFGFVLSTEHLRIGSPLPF